MNNKTTNLEELTNPPQTHCSWCKYQYAHCPEEGNENIDITNCKSFVRSRGK